MEVGRVEAFLGKINHRVSEGSPSAHTDHQPVGATRSLWTYNNERPDIALDGIILKQKLAMSV